MSEYMLTIHGYYQPSPNGPRLANLSNIVVAIREDLGGEQPFGSQIVNITLNETGLGFRHLEGGKSYWVILPSWFFCASRAIRTEPNSHHVITNTPDGQMAIRVDIPEGDVLLEVGIGRTQAEAVALCNQPAPPTPVPAPISGQTATGIPWWVWLIALIGIGGVLALLFFLSKDDKKEEKQTRLSE